MVLKFFEILKTKMTENILPPGLNKIIYEFLDLSQESNSEAVSPELLSVELFDCFTISRRTKVKLFTKINQQYFCYNLISANKSKSTEKFKCVHNKVCDSIITVMFQIFQCEL